MPALDPSLALSALTDVDVKRAHERPLHPQLFLILGRHARRAHRARAVGTPCGQRGVVCDINPGGRSTRGAHAVVWTRLAARPSRGGDRRFPRKRGGLPMDGSSGRVEFLLEFVVFAAQPLPLRLRPAEILAQLLVVSTESLNLARVSRRLGLALRHAPVMPNSGARYKKKKRASCADPLI